MNARTICLFSSMVFWVVIVLSVPRERLLRSNYYGQLFSGMRAFPHPWRKELVHFLCHEYRELLWKSHCTTCDIPLHISLHIASLWCARLDMVKPGRLLGSLATSGSSFVA